MKSFKSCKQKENLISLVKFNDKKEGKEEEKRY
jgi:hypothetical protein